MPHEDLSAKVTSVLRRTGEGFDSAFPGSTEQFVASIVPAFATLLSTLDRFGEEPTRSKESAVPVQYVLSWQLLWEACNGLLAAFILLQRGFATETLAVTRSVLERVACALVLFDNPELIPRFKAGKLSSLSTDAIGPASNVIVDFGSWWGMLSKLGAHVGKDNVGTGIVAISRGGDKDEAHFAIGGHIATTGAEADGWREMMPEFCRIAERLLAAAPEQIFFNPKRRRAAFGKSAVREVM